MTLPDISGFRHPALLFIDSRNGIHQVDGEVWNPAGLAARDRALCVALLRLSLDRLEAAAND